MDAQQTLPVGAEATTVAVAAPEAVAYDAAGNLYIAARNDHAVRKVDPFGIITTVAGTGAQGFAGDGGSATAALLDSPSGVAVDASGTVYIADSRNHRIRVVSNGIITTLAGTGVAGFGGDNGLAFAAQLNLPTSLSLDPTGNLLIADTNNHRIRRISSGQITTVAGTGEQGTGGDGQLAVNALLDTPIGVAADPTSAGSFLITDTHNGSVRRVDANGLISTIVSTGLLLPRGISADASGRIFFADSGNHVVRQLSGGAASTVAGTGEQGFAGDVGAARSAVLDTPRATAIGSNALLLFADTHNGRVRAVASTVVNTVAGLAPPLTEGIVLSGPTSGTYTAANGRLTAVFSSPVAAATGSLQLSVNGQAAATAAITGNTASFDLSGLGGGLQTLAVSYAGDTSNAAIASGVYLVNILAATQTINFPALNNPVTYAPGATAQLAATASSGLPVTYTVSGPATVAGSTLTYTGSGAVTVTATQAGSANYAATTASQLIRVSPSPIVASTVNPGSVPLSNNATTLTVLGSGFTSTSVVRVNGVALPSTVQGVNSITASLPAVRSTATLAATVFDPVTQFESAALPIQVAVPAATAQVNLSTGIASGQQPTAQIVLQNTYPTDLRGVLTLQFNPLVPNTTDTMIRFANGTTTSDPFTITANSTTSPAIPFQTGTSAGSVVLTLTLTAAGANVDPGTARTTTVALPAQVPVSTGVTFTQNGPTLTVTYVGYSNTRNVSQAVFNFKPASGTSLAQTTFTLPVTDLFNSWFNSAASQQGPGSLFTYTQTFNLSDADAKVQSVTVTLTNTAGNSAPTTTP